MVSIPNLDMNLLVVLEVVLGERSVAKAARRLHVTPSAISNALAKLRVALSDPLVIRQGRGIVPTPRALELGPALSRALADLEHAVTLTPFNAATCTRRLTLALADAGQVSLLPKITARFALIMPLARLRVVGIDALLSLGDLSSTEVDLHVGQRATGPGVHSEPLFDEPVVLVARAGHSAHATRLTRRRLGQLQHIGVEMAPGRGFRDPLAAVYKRAGIERTVVITVPTFAAAAAVAAGSDLVSTLPRSIVQAYGARLQLTPLQGAVPRHAVSMSMCWHDRTQRDPAAMELRGLVRDAARI